MSVFSSFATALPFLLQTAPAIKTGLEGKNLKKQKQVAAQMQPLAQMQAQLAGAQTDMNNPLFQNLYSQNREAGNMDLSATIAEISRQNRKLNELGRNPLLDQERGGESIFRNLIKGQEDVGNQARTNTFNQLKAGQNAYAGAQDAYGGIYNAYNDLGNQDYANKLKKVGAQYSIGDALKGLFGLGNGNQTQLNNGETINWNQPSTPAGWTMYQ